MVADRLRRRGTPITRYRYLEAVFGADDANVRAVKRAAAKAGRSREGAHTGGDEQAAAHRADVAKLDQFGEGRVALLANHAKFICMEGDGWYLSSTTSSNLSMNPRTEYYDLTDDEPLYRFFDRFFADCQRWGEGADGAEYKALAAAKTESIEKRAARMGVKTMADLAASCGARPMAEIARG